MASERARRVKRRKRHFKAEQNAKRRAMQSSVVGLTGGDQPTHVYDAQPDVIEMVSPSEVEYIHVETPIVTPSRATCPVCGFSQKVRKNGLMSRHDVYSGRVPQQCGGVHLRWNAEGH